MFRNNKQPTVNFDSKLQAAKYDCILQALKDVAKFEVKTTDVNGYAAAVSSMKTRARLALDFVGNLDKEDDD